MTLDQLSLADIATSSPAAARVLEKHGIDYAVAAARLADVCTPSERQAIAAELAAIDEGEKQLERDWTAEPLGDLIRHLEVEEHNYFRSEFEAIEQRILRVIKIHGTAHPDLRHLPGIFHNFVHDLTVHMQHEEAELFPRIREYVRAIEAGEAPQGSPLSIFGGPLRLMEMEHESTGTALRLLREFARDGEMPTGECPLYNVLLLSLEDLEERLLRHIYLENNVLYPRAAALKASRSRARS